MLSKVFIKISHFDGNYIGPEIIGDDIRTTFNGFHSKIVNIFQTDILDFVT